MLRSISAQATRHSRHLSNVGSFLITRLLAIGAYAVSVPIFVNRTSEAEYGVIAIGFSFLGLSMLMDVAFGYVITQGVGRRLARTGKPHPTLFNRLFWLYLFSSTLVALLLVGILVGVNLAVDERMFFIWLVTLLPALAVSGTVAAVFQAHNSLVYLNTSRFIFELGKAAGLIVAALAFKSYLAVGPLLLLFALLRATLDIRRLATQLGYRVRRPDIDAIRSSRALFTLGLPSLGSVVLALFVSIGDKLLIARWFTKADVAHYALAFDINTKAYLFVSAINSAMFAIMLRNHAVKQSSSAQIRIGLAAVTIMGLIYYLPLILFSKQLLSLWVSPAFGEAAAPLVPILALASLAYLIGNVFEIGLLAKGRSRLVLRIYCVAVLLYFATLLLLVGLIGLPAFAWAYVVFCLTMCAGSLIAHRWHSTIIGCERTLVKKQGEGFV